MCQGKVAHAHTNAYTDTQTFIRMSITSFHKTIEIVKETEKWKRNYCNSTTVLLGIIQVTETGEEIQSILHTSDINSRIVWMSRQEIHKTSVDGTQRMVNLK